MRLTIRILGSEVFHFSTEPDEQQQGPGDCTTYPVGFTASPSDQRYRFVDVDL